MIIGRPFEGSLFSENFLREAIRESAEWTAFDDAALEALEAALGEIFDRFPSAEAPNESQTEDDLIWPVLAGLGWTEMLRQQNLSARGRADVPDGLMFADAQAKAGANELADEWRRYRFGLSIVESKRWAAPLDRGSAGPGHETAPSTQMLRYLRRVDDLTEGRLRWGILTNGRVWRLYFQGALPVSERFFEIDLAAILGRAGQDEDLFAPDEQERRHWLRVFALMFRREAFLPDTADQRTFHRRALDEGRFHEERVAKNLSGVVFGRVFPNLARAVAEAAPDAPLPEVREAVLILLYRLLFILYAEDRDLLPVRDRRYDDYGLRDRVREDIRRRKDDEDTFSTQATRYWFAVDDLCRALDSGDASIGLPPYDGGLFDRQRAPVLAQIRLGDAVMADIVDALSFEPSPTGRRYINYRDLGVQQLGSIYERLLEREIVRDGGEIAVRPSIFARKDSGSYYTHDDLVRLIVRETLDPPIQAHMSAFERAAERLPAGGPERARALERLKEYDPAERLLDLKVCDPAMGSGHFLVDLVDYLSDRAIAAMAEAEAAAEGYVSPLTGRIEGIRATILANARAGDWTVDPARLDDRHIVRRMVLKRCVYGVDKNPMAVELAKVALWLHTFTVGAPLSFLDHHLRCGDSLFGAWVRQGIDMAAEYDAPLLLHGPMRAAVSAARGMREVEALTDAEIAEAHRSAETFAGVEAKTAPLDRFLSLIHAFEWQNLRSREDKAALRAFFDGQFGSPVELALGEADSSNGKPEALRFADLLAAARGIVAEERFFNWQAAFPGVWSNWESPELDGGFDAVIGNPPWDRMRLEAVEWFAMRRPEIALTERAADRKAKVALLRRQGDPLAAEFDAAAGRADDAARIARTGGDFPLLANGELNLYALFVERAMALVKPDGMVGLLTPSGIAADKTAARFFKGVATDGRLKALYDFENRRTRYGKPPFFPDVDSRFKFSAFVASPSPLEGDAMCAFFLQDVSELEDPDRCFPLTAADFARVNPNTGTAPIFRSRRDAELTTAIYGRLPVLVDRSSGAEAKAWPVVYTRMFDMSQDSGLFRTRRELEEQEGAWPIGGNRFDSPAGQWVPLYEGKMVQAYDHRAAGIVVNPDNLHRPAQPEPATLEQHRDPNWQPGPQYWIRLSETTFPAASCLLGFKDVTAPTNMRSMIATLIPGAGVGNTLPIVSTESQSATEAALLLANFNAVPFDYVARQKIQGQHLNWFIVEQLPVVPPGHYETVRFGPKTAAQIVREAVLELTYTAHDMTPFARDMGHVDKAGAVLPPFAWDEGRRLALRAKLDALHFHLYGVTDRDDVRYIYSTFPIVEREEARAWGGYRSRELCLAWMNALAAGRPDATIAV